MVISGKENARTIPNSQIKLNQLYEKENKHYLMKELLDTLELYLQRPSADGKPIRQVLRKKLAELLEEIKLAQ